MHSSTGKIWIGTSNVVLPGNKSTFPPAYQSRSRLYYYASLFNTVEINQTFYKLPRRITFESWAEEVPDDFRFSVKLTREITHSKDLKGDLSLVDGFMTAVHGLGIKKGCLLIQFPGKITLDYFNEVELILEKIEEEGVGWQKVVEFRDQGWYTGETYELLEQFNASLVLQDMPKSLLATPVSNTGFIYMRFHGPTGDYKNGYSTTFLQRQADKIIEWSAAGKTVYVYFNNTIGSAFENAMTLQQLTSPVDKACTFY